MTKAGNFPTMRATERYPSLFGDFFNNFFTTPTGMTPTGMTPALDVVENSDGYQLKLDLPGMTQEQVNVQFADGVLSIQGERTDESRRDEDRWHIVERSHGSFARSVRFPTNVDPARVKAAMKNGVLTVHVPKSETAKTQKIKVAEE